MQHVVEVGDVGETDVVLLLGRLNPLGPLRVERLAREKYWMIGPDETIYRFEDDDVPVDVEPGPNP